MTTLENTKPQSDKISDLTRCHHRRPSGRRCKLAVTAPGAPFCFTHTQEFNKADSLNLRAALLTDHQGFQTAQGINYSLGNLYKLLAANYISPRRAAVLAYINSLQLRTLSAIDADNEAGITDPTAPEEDESLQFSSTPDPTPNDACDTAAPASNTCAEAAQGWDASIPEPDPTKKPS
ncbi:MAG: hypothetical protein WB543_21330 [Candidatus Acidiferrum sp.]